MARDCQQAQAAVVAGVTQDISREDRVEKMNRFNTLALNLLMAFPPFQVQGLAALEAIPKVVDWLKKCRSAWVQHPQFEYLQTFTDLGLPFDDETWAEVMLAFRHRPGVKGLEHSFVVADVRELGHAYAWATRTRIGDFVGVYPLPKHMTCDPHQLLLYSNTMEGRGRGYHARMELKRLLPPKLRPLVSKHRRAGRQPKVNYLSIPLPCNDMKPFVLDASSTVESTHRIQSASTGAINDWLKATKVELPEWYKSRTKMDLWAEDLKSRQPALYAQLAYWMGDARNFYRAVTGQVDPNEVESLFVRLPRTAVKDKQVQMELF